jgi:hypothetical protein
MSDPVSKPFWAGYAAALQKLRIPESKSKFYLLWVKRFGQFPNGVPFHQASPDMLHAPTRYRDTIQVLLDG